MSISTSLITNLTVWRNPQGADSNWKGCEHIYTHLPSLKKIAIAEAAFAAIGIAALVESAVNGLFFLFSLPFLYIDPTSSQLPLARLKTSSFAAVWCAANLVLNISVSNITSKEETALHFAIANYQSFREKFA